MANRLAAETSPYLLQHADNPVDWYPWGDGGARAGQGRGQADPAVDRLLGLPLVPRHGARVVREPRDRRAHERALRHDQGRPRGAARRRRDLHAGRAGDDRPRRLADDRVPHPDGVPFFGGTYFPPEDRHGMPGFRAGARARRRGVGAREREEIRAAGAARPSSRLAATRAAPVGGRALTRPCSTRPNGHSAAQFDPRNGGFGGAPKFPQAMSARVPAARRGRTGDARGSIDDRTTLDAHGAGRHLRPDRRRLRTATRSTAHWLVPHFEKMLYDNALLARAYLHALAASPATDCYRRVAEETLDYVAARDERTRGRLLLGQDADCEGDEGKFYVWSAERAARRVLGDDAGAPAAPTGASTDGPQLRGPQHPRTCDRR